MITMSPQDVALRMMRNGSDPGLIVAYLKLEIKRDPTVAMTEWEAFQYRLKQSMQGIELAFQKIARALRESGL